MHKSRIRDWRLNSPKKGDFSPAVATINARSVTIQRRVLKLFKDDTMNNLLSALFTEIGIYSSSYFI